MASRMSLRVLGLASCLAAASAAGVSPNTAPFSTIYTDNQEYLADYAGNVNNISWPLLHIALTSPNASANATFTGYDWTTAYPGKSIAGHGVDLTTVYDIALPDSVVWNASTTVSSLTFSVPSSMMSSNTAPKAMDQSWYICRHIFVSPFTNITNPDHACSFLGSTCLSDLTTQLTATWGTEDPSTMCAGLAFDSIPASCVGTFGKARMDVIAFDSTVMSDATQAQLMARDAPLQDNWRLGTGFHSPGNPQIWLEALNRTYLVANVFGYSNGSSTKSTPPVTFSCLQPVPKVAVPWNATSTTSTSTVSSTSTSAASSSTGSVSGSLTSTSAKTTSTSSSTTKTATTAKTTTKVSGRDAQQRDRQFRRDDLDFGAPQYLGLNI